MRIQIVADHGASHSAWTKAPADVAKIAEGLGFARVSAGLFWPDGQAFVRRVFRKLRLEHVFNRFCWKLELASVRRKFGAHGGELLLQHPLPGSWTFCLDNVSDIARLKQGGVKIVVLVHDVGALRGSSKEVGGWGDHSWERRLFEIADKLIVHNDRMGEYVRGLGVRGKIVPLQVFDYLVSPGTAFHDVKKVNQNNKILLVGGFGAGKARFSWDLKTVAGIDWTLYGHDFDSETMGAENVHYLGKFDASCPPVESGCCFGLVWDGQSAETCSGPTGEYLRTNNPHKLSLYLAMGLPVIVWKEAAVAAFVEANHVGLTITSLGEIPNVLTKISDAEYMLMSENAVRIAKELRAGAYTKKALTIS